MESHPSIAETLLAAASECVIAVDAAGVIILWNPGAERLYGHTAAEAAGQTLDLIIPEPIRPRHWEAFHVVMKTGVSNYPVGHVFSAPAMTKDGRRLSVEFSNTLLHDAAGNRVGIIAVMRDITAAFEDRRALRKRIAELGG